MISMGKIKSLEGKGAKKMPDGDMEKAKEKITKVAGGIGEYGVNGLLVSGGFAIPVGVNLLVSKYVPRAGAKISNATIVGGATAITLLVASQATKDVAKRVTTHLGYGSSAYFLGSACIDILRFAKVDPFGVVSWIEKYAMPIKEIAVR